MRVLVLFAHPVETSFGAALHRTVVAALEKAGHMVDDVDLYAEDFDPRLSRAERLAYHDVDADRSAVAPYIEKLKAAEALVLVTPVWNFGWPAILKGFFDRVFLPGVSFRIENGKVKPTLRHIRKLAAVVTYGGTRWRALAIGDPPRKIVTRVLRVQIKPGAPLSYLALYDMNRRSDAERAAFLDDVRRRMEAF
ncbi:NAD(P)H-dependent oxidoreductase [Prosthecomicrobium pneumaticum]|uniref:Putative NADPH-quinone reductase n=1 Tax=Prosthecomicrobium pneumaticum TaxID=81895 RepID=A0A7W9CV79_9HYPH|nr:NAD(P)H-dependent oxidoreductase [Prosthecomicrobium pneumaticum]MBB5752510.1 putative NADPH-quinone reductase [Prosthecomicrobium pneumaticum]